MLVMKGILYSEYEINKNDVTDSAYGEGNCLWKSASPSKARKYKSV